MNKQLFYIEYSCGCGNNAMIVKAENEKTAFDYAYERAIEEYDSYEGLHGILSQAEVCEEYGIEDIESVEAETAYFEEKENTVHYHAAAYDAENTDHSSAMEDGVWEI